MFGLGLTQYLPTLVRRVLIGSVRLAQHGINLSKVSVLHIHHRFSKLARLAERKLQLPRYPAKLPVPGGSVAVIGLFKSTTGIGQGARLMAQAMRNTSRKVIAIDVTLDLLHPAPLTVENVVDFSQIDT